MNRRMRRLHRCCAALLILVAACHTVSPDAYRQGETALGGGDLARALAAFDAVPITDLRYPEARLSAAAIERRLRRQLELLLEGLRRRGEWRDDEAIAAFRGALDAWPDHLETQQLLVATQRRRELIAGLHEHAATAAILEVVPPREPGVAVDRGALPVAAGPAIAPPAAATEPPHAIAPSTPLSPPSSLLRTTSEPAAAGDGDAIGQELGKLEARMIAGEIEPILADLFLLQRRAPDDPRVTGRLARLLQQRGLVRYGRGEVGGAVADLQRATELDPALESARVLFALASKDLAAPPR